MVRTVRSVLVACVAAAAFCWPAAVSAQGVSDDDAQLALDVARLTAQRIHDYHDNFDHAFAPATPDYCKDMRSAERLLEDLFNLSQEAEDAGQTELVKELDDVGDWLAGELAYEDYLDWQLGERGWCPPPIQNPLLSLFVPSLLSLTALSSTTANGSPVRPLAQIMFNVGFGSIPVDNNVETSFNTAGHGNASSSPTDMGVDLRTYFWLNPRLALAAGFWASWFAASTASLALDLDNGSPGVDYFLRVQRQWFLMTYVGLTVAWPTISAIRADIAGQPNAGTFTTTLLFGVRREQLHGSISTDSAGLLAATALSLAVTGYTLGLELDYPLWLSGSATALAYGLRPMVGLGFAVDKYEPTTVTHIGAFNQVFASTIALATAYRFYLRLGAQIQASNGRPKF
jgi:hypothetical protein